VDVKAYNEVHPFQVCTIVIVVASVQRGSKVFNMKHKVNGIVTSDSDTSLYDARFGRKRNGRYKIEGREQCQAVCTSALQ
jgi:hypothetical protein